MARRKLRIEVINCLYQYDLLNSQDNKSSLEASNIFNEVLKNLATIDDIIENSLENYSLNRLSYLDRAIVRLATYEMRFTDTPKPIVINEAIEITKEISDIDDKQFKFNNRLLENIKKRI